jgi:hypothetical protein
METHHWLQGRAYLIHLIPGERDGLRRYRVVLEEITDGQESFHFATLEGLMAFLREQEAKLAEESFLPAYELLT